MSTDLPATLVLIARYGAPTVIQHNTLGTLVTEVARSALWLEA